MNAVPAPDLSVIKSMCPTTVTEAGVLTYTFTLHAVQTGNDGDEDNVLLAPTHERDAGSAHCGRMTTDGATFRTLTAAGSPPPPTPARRAK